MEINVHIWNELPDILEAEWFFQTFKMPLSDSFRLKYKCKVHSYMDDTKVLLRSRLNLGFSLNYFSFLFHIFNFFYLRINKPNIHNNIIGISSFETGINDLFSLTGFYFKSKVIEGSHKGKNMFFNFWALLLKMYIFEVVTLFSRLVVIQTTQCFSGSTYL